MADSEYKASQIYHPLIPPYQHMDTAQSKEDGSHIRYIMVGLLTVTPNTP